MTDLRDPDLDELVRELNRRTQEAADAEAGLAFESPDGAISQQFDQPLTLLRPGQALINEGESLNRFLAEMVRRQASDMLLIAGLQPVFRVNGRLTRME